MTNTIKAPTDSGPRRQSTTRGLLALQAPMTVGEIAGELDCLAGTDTGDRLAHRLGYRTFSTLERALEREGQLELLARLRATRPVALPRDYNAAPSGACGATRAARQAGAR